MNLEIKKIPKWLDFDIKQSYLPNSQYNYNIIKISKSILFNIKGNYFG